MTAGSTRHPPRRLSLDADSSGVLEDGLTTPATDGSQVHRRRVESIRNHVFPGYHAYRSTSVRAVDVDVDAASAPLTLYLLPRFTVDLPFRVTHLNSSVK
jgi:hypothetical protein